MDNFKKTISEENSRLEKSETLFRIASFQYNEPLYDIMDREVYTCGPGASVQAVAMEMAKRKISSVIVTDEKLQPLGIVTERDMVRKIIAESRCAVSEKIISDIMTENPVCLPHDGTLFDALSLLSRHAVKHLPVVSRNQVVGIITLRRIMKIRYSEPLVLIGRLEDARSAEDFRRIKDDVILLVKEKLDANTDPADIVTMISLINASIHKRLLSRIIELKNTPPPADFCFFVTGSHGRKENLLFPDQDFCVIIEDYPKSRTEEIDGYFYEISRQLSDALHKAGFEYCPGKIMGHNPDWRKRVSEWLTFVTGVFEKQGPYTVRYMTLIFDSACLFGSSSLFGKYMKHAFLELSKHHNVLRQMHDEEEGRHKVPLGLFNTFITEKGDGHKGEIDMKKSGLIFMIESARVLALKNQIQATSTLGRIRGLVEKGVIQKDDSEYFENAYRVILYHTLKAQVDNYLDKSSHDYYLDPRKLSHRGQETLKEAFKAISKLQEIVGSEFGELIL